MAYIYRCALILVAMGTGYSAVNAADPLTIFEDDFQTDTAGQTGSGGDLDPAIDVANDIGGSWVTRESALGNLRVINDTAPGNAEAGTDNYVQMIRGGSASSIAKLYGTNPEWPAMTLNRVVQLDFSVFKESNALLSVWLFNAAPPTSTGSFPNNATQAIGADLFNELSNDTWQSVRFVANLSPTEEQMGIPAQQYSMTIGETTTFHPFLSGVENPVAQVRSFGFYTGQGPSTQYIDNVQFQILNPLTNGDFNDDGLVDAADYVDWRKRGGPPEEYQEWVENFGNVYNGGGGAGGESSAIPEPSALALIAIGLAVGRIAFARRKRVA